MKRALSRIIKENEVAFTANNMQTFSKRVQNYMLAIQNLREEGARLHAIYLQETGSGSDPEFGDTAIATGQEHIDAIVYMLAFKDFNENAAVATADRMANITPFLQVE